MRKLKSRQTGNKTRIGEHSLYFTSIRFRDPDDEPLWVWSVRTGHQDEDLYRIADIHPDDLRKMIVVLEQQIRLIETDGHPKYEDDATPDKGGE